MKYFLGIPLPLNEGDWIEAFRGEHEDWQLRPTHSWPHIAIKGGTGLDEVGANGSRVHLFGRRRGQREAVVAIIGSEQIHITQRYVVIHAAPQGGGSLMASNDPVWLSDDSAAKRAASRQLRRQDPGNQPFVAYMIVGQSTPIGINQYGSAYKVVQALEAQGYMVHAHDDRTWSLELADASAPEDSGPSSDVTMVEPPQMGCARWLGALIARRKAVT